MDGGKLLLISTLFGVTNYHLSPEQKVGKGVHWHGHLPAMVALVIVVRLKRVGSFIHLADSISLKAVLLLLKISHRASFQHELVPLRCQIHALIVRHDPVWAARQAANTRISPAPLAV